MIFVWIVNALLGCISTFFTLINYDIEIIPMCMMSYGYIFSGIVWIHLTNYYVRVRNIKRYVLIFITLILILSEHLVIYAIPLDAETAYWLKCVTLLGVISQYLIYILGQIINFIIRRTKSVLSYVCLMIIPLLVFGLLQIYVFKLDLLRVIMVGNVCLGGAVLYYIYIAKIFSAKIKLSYVVSLIFIIASIMLYAITEDLFKLEYVILFQILILSILISIRLCRTVFHLGVRK